jgi:hypothetical protein
MTFREEYKSLLDAYGIKYDEKYAFDWLSVAPTELW